MFTLGIVLTLKGVVIHSGKRLVDSKLYVHTLVIDRVTL